VNVVTLQQKLAALSAAADKKNYAQVRLLALEMIQVLWKIAKLARRGIAK